MDTRLAEPTGPREQTPRRYPRGSECECTVEGCGEFFSGESAFEKHWTKKSGHVHPSEVGLVQRQHVGGPVWGHPGEIPTDALRTRREGTNPAPPVSPRPKGRGTASAAGSKGRRA